MSRRAIVNIMLLMPLVALITMGDVCDDGGGSSGQYIETPQDACPSWDTDCDGISNAVETNDANSYLNLDPDTPNANPSIAHGTPNSGWLENGLNLVNSGTGYYHYLGTDGIDIDDWGVLHLINMIESAGRDWYDNFMTPPRIGVGDLSLQQGGKFDIHDSHKNGLDVDLRYVRNDNQENSLNIADDQSHYDTDATGYLMNLFVFSTSARVQVILYDSVNAHLIGGPLLHWPGHSDHFHIRIDDPDGTGN